MSERHDVYRRGVLLSLALVLIVLAPPGSSTSGQQRVSHARQLDNNLELGSNGFNRGRPRGGGIQRSTYTVSRATGEMRYNERNAFRRDRRYGAQRPARTNSYHTRNFQQSHKGRRNRRY